MTEIDERLRSIVTDRSLLVDDDVDFTAMAEGAMRRGTRVRRHRAVAAIVAGAAAAAVGVGVLVGPRSAAPVPPASATGTPTAPVGDPDWVELGWNGLAIAVPDQWPVNTPACPGDGPGPRSGELWLGTQVPATCPPSWVTPAPTVARSLGAVWLTPVSDAPPPGDLTDVAVESVAIGDVPAQRRDAASGRTADVEIRLPSYDAVLRVRGLSPSLTERILDSLRVLAPPGSRGMQRVAFGTVSFEVPADFVVTHERCATWSPSSPTDSPCFRTYLRSGDSYVSGGVVAGDFTPNISTPDPATAGPADGVVSTQVVDAPGGQVRVTRRDVAIGSTRSVLASLVPVGAGAVVSVDTDDDPGLVDRILATLDWR